MKLPNREGAFIPSSKLNGYLLSRTHPDGKSKARFFRSFGFNDSNSHLLETGLLTIAQTREVDIETKTSFGVKYAIDGELTTPGETIVNVRTVWIIETGEDFPRFVTAHPISKQSD
jgi:hypothetical protein